MKGLIKKFVLLTLILQLCYSVQIVKGTTVGQPRALVLGDLLKFDRRLPCLNTPLYSHYAVYIGHTPLEGKGPDDDIFEMTKADGKTGCRFSKLKERPIIYNYLDETLDARNPEEMKRAVEAMKQNCGKWTLINTCEHVATHVRYGEVNRQCNQPNTLVGPICTFVHKIPDILKKLFRGRRSKYLRLAAAAA